MPSQKLEIHRCLIAALLNRTSTPTMATSIKRSSGCFLFRTLLFFVKRKALEYCEQLLNVQYTTVFQDGITEQLKKKNEVLQTRVRA